jgi:hypothetical protein
MTLDDLKRIFQKARQGTRDWNGTEWVGDYGGDDAGIRAVVTALRDEILRDYGGNNYSCCERVALGSINEILTSDGVKSEGSE